MKKIIAIVLCLTFTLSLVACTTKTNSSITDTSASSQNTTVDNTSSTSGEQEDNTSSNLPETSFNDVTSLEDFANKLEEDGYKPAIKEYKIIKIIQNSFLAVYYLAILLHISIKRQFGLIQILKLFLIFAIIYVAILFFPEVQKYVKFI